MEQGKFNLRNELINFIDLQVEKFIDRIVKKYNLNKDELLSIWEKGEEVANNKKDIETIVETSICTYISTAGEKCKTRVRNGGILCCKHRPKTNSTKIKLEPVIESINKSKILRMHKKLKKYYHAETGFVFKSKEEKIVIGKIEGDLIVKLNERNVADCKCWGFAYEYTEEIETEEENE